MPEPDLAALARRHLTPVEQNVLRFATMGGPTQGPALVMRELSGFRDEKAAAQEIARVKVKLAEAARREAKRPPDAQRLDRAMEVPASEAPPERAAREVPAPEAPTSGTSLMRAEVLRFVRQHGPVSAAKVRAQVGVPARQLEAIVASLVAHGELVRKRQRGPMVLMTPEQAVAEQANGSEEVEEDVQRVESGGSPAAGVEGEEDEAGGSVGAGLPGADDGGRAAAGDDGAASRAAEGAPAPIATEAVPELPPLAEGLPTWEQIRSGAVRCDPVTTHFAYLDMLFGLARQPCAPQHVFERIERLMIQGPPARNSDGSPPSWPQDAAYLIGSASVGLQ